MSPARKLFLILALAGVAALATWLALKVERPPSSEVMPKETGAVAAPVVAPRDRAPEPHPAAASASAPVSVPASSDAPPTQEVTHEGEEATAASADQRQDAKIARGLSLNAAGGIRVDAVPEGSPARQLRLEPGDVIVSVNDEPVASPAEFVRIYRAQGLPTELTILRNGREFHRH
jgi:membrane-associated protease RseP (regulator of RpoE activity)